MPTARRLYYALEIVAQPTLLEPIFSCDITAPSECMGGVYQSLNQRRGQVVEETQIAGTPLNIVLFNLFRLKLICPSLNHSVSLVCLEETLKEKPSLNVSLTIGRSLRDFHLLMPKLENSFLVSGREKDLKKSFLSSKTTWISCDVHKFIILISHISNLDTFLLILYTKQL